MARKSKVIPKYRDDNPNLIAIRKYEEEIKVLEKKRDDAEKECNWTMRHFFANQITAKRTNMEMLQSKLGTRRTFGNY